MVSCSDKLLRSGDAHVELVPAPSIQKKRKRRRRRRRGGGGERTRKEGLLESAMLSLSFSLLCSVWSLGNYYRTGRASCLILLADARRVSRATIRIVAGKCKWTLTVIRSPTSLPSSVSETDQTARGLLRFVVRAPLRSISINVK